MPLERNLGMDLVRCTEAAALRAARLMGRGDKIAADQAAVDAMRFMLDSVPMDGVVVIGEGEKDAAPMLYTGEQVGTGEPPEVDVAVDPVEGTTLLAEGMPGAIAVVALAERGSLYSWSGMAYMDKLAVGEARAWRDRHQRAGGREYQKRRQSAQEAAGRHHRGRARSAAPHRI